jgi:hypothetical protein
MHNLIKTESGFLYVEDYVRSGRKDKQIVCKKINPMDSGPGTK